MIKRKPMWPWWTLVGIIAAWLLWMTLRPNQTVAAGLAPLTTSATAHGISTRLLIDLAGNIAVFVPLGATLALALGDKPTNHRFLLATLGGATFSLIIELVQTAIPTRVATLDDWLLNTAGVAAGAMFGCWASKRQPTQFRHTTHQQENSNND